MAKVLRERIYTLPSLERFIFMGCQSISMKITLNKQWMPRFGGALLAGCVTMLSAQESSGVEKFDPTAFPGYVVDEVVVPVPSEIFAVLDKLGDPNWKDEVRELKNPDTSDRTELSLIFGLVVAEGFVAVQAEDKQTVEDIGREVINLAGSLGLTKAVRPHAQSILDAVKKNDWKAVRKEFDQTQATVRAEMERMQDSDLAQCVSLGGWLRGTASVTSVITKNYTADRAELLNQPLLVDHFIAAVSSMPESTKTNHLIAAIGKGLGKIREAMESGDGNIPLEKVTVIQSTSEDLLNLILKAKASGN